MINIIETFVWIAKILLNSFSTETLELKLQTDISDTYVDIVKLVQKEERMKKEEPDLEEPIIPLGS